MLGCGVAFILAYRFYFMNPSDAISSVENLDCTADDEARRHATDMLAARPHHYAIEIWQLDASLLVMTEAPADRPHVHFDR
jgi:hypothetical protein